MSALDWIVTVVGGILLFGAILGWHLSRSYCEPCGHHKRKCECCPHPTDDRAKARWTQDGWVEVCLVCGEWIYLGDDYACDYVEGKRRGNG